MDGIRVETGGTLAYHSDKVSTICVADFSQVLRFRLDFTVYKLYVVIVVNWKYNDIL